MSSNPYDLLSHETLLNEASDLLLAALASIPPAKINPKTYWPWAQKALTVAGDSGSTFERFVSVMHRQLQMGDTPYTSKACARIHAIGESLKSKNEYQRFRRMVRDHAPYIVVLARVRKDALKGKKDEFSEWMEDPSKGGLE